MKFAILSTILVLCLTSIASTIEGMVVRVSDGDTLTILDEAKTQHKIRLVRIDAPEKSQAFVIQIMDEDRTKRLGLLGELRLMET